MGRHDRRAGDDMLDDFRTLFIAHGIGHSTFHCSFPLEFLRLGNSSFKVSFLKTETGLLLTVFGRFWVVAGWLTLDKHLHVAAWACVASLLLLEGMLGLEEAAGRICSYVCHVLQPQPQPKRSTYVLYVTLPLE